MGAYGLNIEDIGSVERLRTLNIDERVYVGNISLGWFLGLTFGTAWEYFQDLERQNLLHRKVIPGWRASFQYKTC